MYFGHSYNNKLVSLHIEVSQWVAAAEFSPKNPYDSTHLHLAWFLISAAILPIHRKSTSLCRILQWWWLKACCVLLYKSGDVHRTEFDWQKMVRLGELAIVWRTCAKNIILIRSQLRARTPLTQNFTELLFILCKSPTVTILLSFVCTVFV